MRANEYIKLGLPRLRATGIRFLGVGSNEIIMLGEFRAKLTIDGHSYPILIRVVSDIVLQQKLVVGTDFLNTVEVNIKQGVTMIKPICTQMASVDDSPDIVQINTCKTNIVDASYVQNADPVIARLYALL